MKIAIDIGGTFTDLVATDEAGAVVYTHKLLTRHDDLAGMVEDAVANAAAASATGNDRHVVVHGTTLVANALVERRGAATALLVTAGFRDVLEIGREDRYDLYDLDLERPRPLVDRPLRLEVKERLFCDGTTAQELDEQSVIECGRQLRDAGVESVAVVLLHSYRHPLHEEAVRRILEGVAPDVDVSLSHEVLSEIGEYDRMSTTVANAYVRPLTTKYLDTIDHSVRRHLGARATVALVSSTGRLAPLKTMKRQPIRLLESGPAGGVLAGVELGNAVGAKNVLCYDMGGTTAKASYVTDGDIRVSPRFEVARVRRFARGSGLPIQVPSIELIEIGAGGGSIAWVDALGLLRVGPQSAGSDPGPACYGNGGIHPTVTDADVVLGYLGSSLLAGYMSIDVEAAHRVMRRLGGELGTDGALGAARAVRRVVGEQMASAARRHAVESGLDAGAYTLVATGGAGPMHACDLARALGIRTVVIGAGAGVASARGFLAARLGFDLARSDPHYIDDIDWAETEIALKQLEEKARSAADVENAIRRVEAEMRYRGSGGWGGSVTVAVPDHVLDERDTSALKQLLDSEYLRRYGRVPEGVLPELLTWRLSVTAAEEPTLVTNVTTEDAATGTSARADKQVWFEGHGTVTTPFIAMGEASGRGPAVISDPTTTIVVPPSATMELVTPQLLVLTLE